MNATEEVFFQCARAASMNRVFARAGELERQGFPYQVGKVIAAEEYSDELSILDAMVDPAPDPDDDEGEG